MYEDSIAVDFEQLVVPASGVKSLTPAKIYPTGARPRSRALVTVNTGAIRIKWNGDDPTVTEGHMLSAGSHFPLEGSHNLRNLRMISVTGEDCEVAVTYERI